MATLGNKRLINPNKILNLSEAQAQEWDVIIIGGGMGGGSAAFSLSNKGHKVLIIEKGLANFKGAAQGIEIENEDPEERLKDGKWPQKLCGEVDGSFFKFWAPLGCGLGGSSLLYAAALQRLRAEDFETQKIPNGETVDWPFSYKDFEPYYQAAERLFSVCGTDDPLEPESKQNLTSPPVMCETDRHYFQAFKKADLNPYRIHIALKHNTDCGKCGGYICKYDRKQDSLNSCIAPAIESGNMFVTERAEVTRLCADQNRVTAVEARQNSKLFQIKAKQVALAAGGYFTPVLLLKSKSNIWPQGLANSSGLVGCNLMFHASDFIAFWPKIKSSGVSPNKAIAVRDFYSVDGQKFGEFQSTGLTADYGYVLYALRLLFDQSRFKKLSPLRHFLRIPAFAASKLYGKATVFSTIVEDFPYRENRIVVDENMASGMRFEYSIKDEFRHRVYEMRKRIRNKLSFLRSMPMNIGINLNYGHPCGTCKAGHDPSSSVVDKDCKTHDLDNLYVVDSSFMPTSGGTNPSLTIAANALRVAEAIDQQLQNRERKLDLSSLLELDKKLTILSESKKVA